MTSRWWLSTSAIISRSSRAMKGWRSKAGRRPSGSGRKPEEIIASRASTMSPSAPSVIQRLSSRYQGRKRQFSCTMSRVCPATRRTRASARASVGVSGFWHSTAIPRAAAASTQSAWVSRGEATSSASSASFASSAAASG